MPFCSEKSKKSECSTLKHLPFDSFLLGFYFLRFTGCTFDVRGGRWAYVENFMVHVSLLITLTQETVGEEQLCGYANGNSYTLFYLYVNICTLFLSQKRERRRLIASRGTDQRHTCGKKAVAGTKGIFCFVFVFVFVFCFLLLVFMLLLHEMRSGGKRSSVFQE